MRIIHQLVWAAIAVTVLGTAACKKDPVIEIPVLGESLEGIKGEWKLSRITQTDEVSKASPKPVLDISTFFIGNNPLKITFNKESLSYTVAQNDSKGNYFGAGGAFRFDNADYPSQVILTPTGSTADLVMPLGSPVRKGSILEVKYNRPRRGKKGITYNFTFVR